ncbi:hypothetical protein L1987_61878 [Smallanthus sonchifolius]|uniref:Uncharacterized protein n=1 Tax=Smallanthus sonchifolius TaxID=185202 RepID=A0ACB9C8X9_9ASTR|nr:hypothetical protein L1987_61878 [Smallanthus sonchifolius]
MNMHAVDHGRCDSRGGAIACMLIALLFLGTWPAILTLLERRGRLPQHTYLDYTITNLLAAVIIAFTFGEFGHTNDDNSSFLAQLSQVFGKSTLIGLAICFFAADAVQALPLVSTFWGVLFFGEYCKLSRRTYVLLAGMLSIFSVSSSAMGIAESRFLITFTTEGLGSVLKMYVVDSKGGAITCMLLALLFLGSWPAILTLLERRGRLPQHTYLDYTITNLLAAVIIAFTFGEFGHSNDDMPNFLDQLTQNNWPSVLFAMAGGVGLSLGNLTTQYAWAFVGLSVTNVICSSITVVIGTTMNYFLDDKINRAEILFPGVACFLIAACLGSLVHASNAKDNQAKLDEPEVLHISGKGLISNESNTSSSKKAKAGTANFLIELESRRAIKVFGTSTLIGLVICFFAGICFSLFSPAFNLATNDQWHTLDDDVPHLSVYTTFFYFSCSCFVIAIILNITFLYHPTFNLPRSSIMAYLNDWDGRGWAFLAGFLCGFGNGLQFMGGQAAGYAAADAVQALPLVSTFWGVLLFGEYHKSSRRTYVLLVGMLSMFIVAVGVLMASSGHRKQ